MDDIFNSIFSKYDEKISSLALAARNFLIKNLSDIIEIPDLPANMLAYGYGKGYKDMICTIIPSKKEIKIGFNRGSEFKDSHNLLKGSGKVHKYIVIRTESDIHDPRVLELLEEALNAYRLRTSK